jgi:hypothetical protein
MTDHLSEKARRLKRASLLSSVGALTAGIGIGLMLPDTARPGTVPTLLVGLLVHGWGMLETHRLEGMSDAAQPRWAEALYWLCWLSMIGLAALIAVQAL